MPEAPANAEEELAFAGLSRQAELLATGEASSVELVNLCLERIEATQGTLNAFRIVRAEAAVAEAERRIVASPPASACLCWACRLRSRTTST